MRIEIVPEINRVLRRDEHGAKFGDLGMFLLKPFAPFFCQASVFLISASRAPLRVYCAALQLPAVVGAITVTNKFRNMVGRVTLPLS